MEKRRQYRLGKDLLRDSAGMAVGTRHGVAETMHGGVRDKPALSPPWNASALTAPEPGFHPL